jgi:hypothetical protein
VAAAVALLDMAAKRGGATQLDRGHRATLRRGKSGAMLLTISLAAAAEHVRHFRSDARHWASIQAGAGRGLGAAEVGDSRASNGLAVAHTLLVARRR